MPDSNYCFTFISRSPPYGSGKPQLCLDTALAAAVFEQKVNYIFQDDGVYQLLRGQNSEGISSKSLGAMLETLDLYGIQEVLVDKAALESRGLSPEDLLIPVTIIDASMIGDLIAESNCVINL